MSGLELVDLRDRPLHQVGHEVRAAAVESERWAIVNGSAAAMAEV